MNAHPWPLVMRLSENRLRIKGLLPHSSAMNRLVDWLEEREQIRTVSPGQNGTVDVVYQANEKEAASFQRSLEDHLFAAIRPSPEPPDVRIIHHLPGRVRLGVSGVTDEDVLRLTAWIRNRPGVLRASGSPASHSILTVFDPDLTTADQLAADARTSDPQLWPAAPPLPPGPPWGNVAVSSAALAGAVGGFLPAGVVSGLVAWSALPAVERSLKALREKRASVDLLDVTAVGLSVASQQLTTGAFITWLLSIGDVLLEKAADRARTELTRLVSLEAPEAWRLENRGGTEKAIRVPAARLKPGDRIVVSSGQRIAGDGVVCTGTAFVDEKALTGESELKERGVGSRVLAATVVVDGEIVVRLQRVGTGTTAARIVQVLASAEAKPMTLQRNAERVADRFVLPTFGLAGAALALSGQVERLMSVLIIDFGTGLRIALPTGALAAVAVAARNGVLVKGAQYLERLSKADVIIFDKTGTLTRGEPEIMKIVPVNGFTTQELICFAAGAEAQASHPVAQALRRCAERSGVRVPQAVPGSATSAIGRGVAARVCDHDVRVGSVRWMREAGLALDPAEAVIARLHEAHLSPLLVAVDGKLVGVLGYADAPRDESASVVEQLRAGGRRQVMLFSGDTRTAVDAVARVLGVDHAYAEMLPEDKAEEVRRLQRQGKVVAMVGDGINDAPALALADVGISLHGGADVALETADVVLLRGGLEWLPLAFDVADEAMRNVRRELGVVIVPNAVAMVLAAFGLLPPTIAALINNGSTIVAALAGLAPLVKGPAAAASS